MGYLYWALTLVCCIVDDIEVVCEGGFLNIVAGGAGAVVVENLAGIVLVFEVPSWLKMPGRRGEMSW